MRDDGLTALALSAFKRMCLDYLEVTKVPLQFQIDDDDLRELIYKHPLINLAMNTLDIDPDYLLDRLMKIKYDKDERGEFNYLYHIYVQEDE